MKTPKFQSVDEFIQDHEAYKSGKRYKLIYIETTSNNKTTEYVKDTLLGIRLESISYFYNKENIGVVDLKHKFEVVCKVP